MGRWICIVVVFFITLTGCASDEKPTRINDLTPLTSIVIEADLSTLAPGTSTRLKATGNYGGWFERDITDQVDWIVTPSGSVVTNVSAGRIRAVAQGEAILIATLAGVDSNQLTLTVSDANLTTMTIAPLLPSLPQGLYLSFSAEGTFSDTTTQDLTFDVDWLSSLPAVATINSEGEVSALALGSTTISATFDLTALKEETILTVTDPVPLSIVVTAPNSSLLSLSKQNYTATGKYSNGTSPDITTKVLWTSSNPAIAAIATDAQLEALTSGTTTITATLGTISGSTPLKVTGGNLESIALTIAQAANNTLINGTTSRISAIGTFSNGTTRDITRAIERWDDEANVNAEIVPDTGNLVWVHALDSTVSGTILSASNGSITGEKTLIVTAPPLSNNSLSIPEQTLELTIGTSGLLSLSGIFSPTSTQNLALSAEWKSATLAVATVGNDGQDKGLVHAVAAGTSNMTATYDGQEATTTVTVKARTLSSVTISAVTVPTTFIAGTQKVFKVTASYSDGFTQDVTADATWSIDNTNIALFPDVLADPGLVVAVDAGSTILTATFGSMNDTETLVVSL